MTISMVQKAIAAAVGFLAQIAAAGLLSGTAQSVVQVIIGVLQIAGVYWVKNAPQPSTGKSIP